MVDLNAPTPHGSTPGDATSVGATQIFRWLTPFGANFGENGRLDFGDVGSEAAAAIEADIVAPLAELGVIRASGVDADNFLQGQLSNDLRELTQSHAQLSSYNSPKGRALAIFTLLRRPDAIWLETQRDVIDATLKRLRMFLLRSKLKLDDAGAEVVSFGIAGPNAEAVLAHAALPVPKIVWACVEAEGIVVVRRPGAAPRYTLHGTEAQLQMLWPGLTARARPVGTQAWSLLDMLSGLPAIHPDTSDQHVAQMLNLDSLGGISFAKGCYPGQEIVARLHYLGSLKRRLFLGYTIMEGAARGLPIYADGHDGAIGEVLDVAPHPTRGWALQMVLQLSHSQSAPLRLGAVDGVEIKLAV